MQQEPIDLGVEEESEAESDDEEADDDHSSEISPPAATKAILTPARLVARPAAEKGSSDCESGEINSEELPAQEVNIENEQPPLRRVRKVKKRRRKQSNVNEVDEAHQDRLVRRPAVAARNALLSGVPEALLS